MGGKDCSKPIWETLTGCAHELCTRAVPEELDVSLAWHWPPVCYLSLGLSFHTCKMAAGAAVKLKAHKEPGRHLGQWLCTGRVYKGPLCLEASVSVASVRPPLTSGCAGWR